ncbi:MAG: UDP-3-O-acyl-N-acetylglucosamine deacetylase [Candidatus Dojkabacteria bacterium]
MKIELLQDTKKQRTISTSVVFEGQSLFSTDTISMTLHPSEENTGIFFNINGNKIPCNSDYLNSTELHTTSLIKDGTTVLMIEHLMAAVYGLGIDNLEIKMSCNVVPAQDASSESFANTLIKAGIVEQDAFRTVINVLEPLHFEQPEFTGRKAQLNPSKDGFILKVTAPFPKPIGTHTVTFSEDDDFKKKVSWARTFLRSSLDLKDLTKWDGIRTVYRALPEDPKESPIITFTDKKFLTPLKKDNEPATHKLLDTLGDLTLVGYRIRGMLDINMPGHKFTHQIAREIRSMI